MGIEEYIFLLSFEEHANEFDQLFNPTVRKHTIESMQIGFSTHWRHTHIEATCFDCFYVAILSVSVIASIKMKKKTVCALTTE